MVAALVLILVMGVIQIAIAVHVRSLLIDSAAEGARRAALTGNSVDDGTARARELITADLNASYAKDVTGQRTVVDGLDVIEVTVRAPLPVIGLLGPAGTIEVHGHALVEQP